MKFAVIMRPLPQNPAVPEVHGLHGLKGPKDRSFVHGRLSSNWQLANSS